MVELFTTSFIKFFKTEDKVEVRCIWDLENEG